MGVGFILIDHQSLKKIKHLRNMIYFVNILNELIEKKKMYFRQVNQSYT